MTLAAGQTLMAVLLLRKGLHKSPCDACPVLTELLASCRTPSGLSKFLKAEQLAAFIPHAGQIESLVDSCQTTAYWDVTTKDRDTQTAVIRHSLPMDSAGQQCWHLRDSS